MSPGGFAFMLDRYDAVRQRESHMHTNWQYSIGAVLALAAISAPFATMDGVSGIGMVFASSLMGLTVLRGLGMGVLRGLGVKPGKDVASSKRGERAPGWWSA